MIQVTQYHMILSSVVMSVLELVIYYVRYTYYLFTWDV